MLHFAANIFYQYAWNIWINLWIITRIWFWLVNILTNCNYLWLALAKGCIVSCQYHIFLARIQGSSTLRNKNCKRLDPPKVCQGGAGGLGKDILTSEILYHSMTNVCMYIYICMRWTMQVSASFSFCFPLLVIFYENWS